MRFAVDTVVFHDVDLATRRPLHPAAQRPDGWPRTRSRWNLGAHFKPSIEETLLSCRRQTSRGIVDEFALFAPMTACGVVGGIAAMLATGLDDETSVLLPGVGCLIPLSLLITHESLFEVPHSAVWSTVAVELVAPDQMKTFCPDGRHHRQHGSRPKESFHCLRFIFCKITVFSLKARRIHNS